MSEDGSGASLTLDLRPDPDVVALLASFFADYRRRGSGPSQAVRFDPDLWERLRELGLTRLTGSESRGGGGASWVEASSLLGVAAAAAAPVPLAEHDVVGGWLVEIAGLDEQVGVRTVCTPDAVGLARGVPWGRDATSIATLWQSGDGWKAADVQLGRVQIKEGRNLAGEPSDEVRFLLTDLQAGVDVAEQVATEYRLRLTLARCAQIAGAINRVLVVVVDHVNQRLQFGRPVGRFQAVQALVADLAGEAALAQTATDAAVTRAVARGWDDPGLPFAVAVAASTVGHASSVVVRNAHQATGAIGATLEHELPRMTKFILAHRGDVLSVHEWDAVVSGLARDAGPDGLWTLITTTTTQSPAAL